MSLAAMMLVALVIDAVLGWPARLHALIGHPVTWVGRLIAALDSRLNRNGDGPGVRRFAGVLAAATVVGATAVPALLVQRLLPDSWIGIAVGGIIAWPLVAGRSLHEHVTAVAEPLIAGRTAEARTAVAKIVGRDPAQLDNAAIARATLESLAENTSDGVVAPLFWGALLGLPGIAVYKAINTMDSMIGHRTSRHAAFGMAAARLDDLANLIPARLTGLLIALMSGRPMASLRVMFSDARRHRSPNAGWPEAAMAGALGVRLSGPRVYGNRVADEPWINGASPNPAPEDLKRGLALYRWTIVLLAAIIGVLALI